MDSVAGKRVVVLYRRSLLTQSVEGLLKGRKDLEVIGVDLDTEGALGQVKQARPCCVIVDNADLPEDWSRLSFQLWTDNPRIRFVYLNMSGNRAEVVSGKQVVVNSVKDLVRVLEHPWGNRCGGGEGGHTGRRSSCAYRTSVVLCTLNVSGNTRLT